MSNKSLLFQRPTDVETPTGFFIDYLTGITDGVWPIAVTFMSFSLVYLSLNDYNPKKAYAAASFTSLITVTMLVGLGAFTSEALIVVMIMVILAVVINGGGRS